MPSVHRRVRVREGGRSRRPQARLLAGSGDHGGSRARFRAGALVLGTDRLPLPAGPGRRGRLSGQCRPDDRVRQRQGPGPDGWPGLLDPGAGLHHRAVDRTQPARASPPPRWPGGCCSALARSRRLPLSTLRRRMPESPRYLAQVQGRADAAASQMSQFTAGTVRRRIDVAQHQMGLRAFLTNRKYLDHAGRNGWLLVPPRLRLLRQHHSTPADHRLISPHSTTMTKIAIQLAIFVVAAVPGYALAIARMDRIWHRRLQPGGLCGDGAVSQPLSRWCPV